MGRTQKIKTLFMLGAALFGGALPAFAIGPLTNGGSTTSSGKPKVDTYYLIRNGKAIAYTDRAEWFRAGGENSGRIEYADGNVATYAAGRVTSSTDTRSAGADGSSSSSEKGTSRQTQAQIEECENSAQIGGKTGKDYRCGQTYTATKATETANAVLTTAGRNVINTMGAASAQKMNDGHLSGAQDAAAKMAKTSFAYETSLGAANVAAAALLAKRAKKHDANLQSLKSEKERLEYNVARNPNDAEAARELKKYNTALVEQRLAKQTAKVATFQAAMVGAQAIAGATVSKKMQKDAEQIAAMDRANQKLIQDNTFAYDASQLYTTGTGETFDPDQQAATSGTESSSELTSNDGGTGSDDPFAGLGAGNDTGGGDESGPVGPAPGKRTSDAGGGAGGGAGGAAGGGVGAGGGGGGGEPTEESKASYASEFGTKERYETGAAGGAKGAKGGAAAGGEGDGIDLNGLLAQFLPKGEADIGPQNGILDFAGNFDGARGLANEQPGSYLDKNADLFQRIHETMTEKNRKGHVGI